MQFTSIWFIDTTLSGATTLGQNGPGRDGNEGVLSILLNSSITEASASDCLVSYPGHSWVGGVLSLCRDAVDVFYGPSRQSKPLMGKIIVLSSKISPWCRFLFFFSFSSPMNNKIFYLDFMNHKNSARSGGPKIMDSVAVLQVIEANSSTWRVAGNSQFCMVGLVHNLRKNIWNC